MKPAYITLITSALLLSAHSVSQANPILGDRNNNIGPDNIIIGNENTVTNRFPDSTIIGNLVIGSNNVVDGVLNASLGNTSRTEGSSNTGITTVSLSSSYKLILNKLNDYSTTPGEFSHTTAVLKESIRLAGLVQAGEIDEQELVLQLNAYTKSLGPRTIEETDKFGAFLNGLGPGEVDINSTIIGSSNNYLGTLIKIEGSENIALGDLPSIKGNRNIALGSNAAIDAADAIAIGSNTKVTHAGSVALGSGSVANGQSLGNAAYLIGGQARSELNIGDRRITGVSGGALDNDAVNLEQLKRVEKTINDKINLIDRIDVINNNPTIIEVRDNSLVKKEADGTITIGKEADGKTVNVSGKEGPRVLTGIANGTIAPRSTEAINGGQLFDAMISQNSRIDRLNDKIRDNRKVAAQGVAAAMAMQIDLPEANPDGWSGGIGLASYDRESALAMGTHYLSQTGRHKLSSAISTGLGNNAKVGAKVSWGFKLN